MVRDLNVFVGVHHKLCSLEELTSELKQDIDALTSKLGNKEGEWASLSKATSTLLSDFILETERFVDCLEKTKEEQVNVTCPSFAYKVNYFVSFRISVKLQ